MDLVEKLAAIEEIKQLKSRYFRAVDLKDAALLRAVFSDDATADYRGAATDPRSGLNAVPDNTEAVVEGGDAITDGVMASVANLVSVHHGSVPEITLTSATTAEGIWPMVDLLRLEPGGPVAEMVGYGHYYETYRREADGWKITTLKLTRLRVDITPWAK